MTSAADLDPRDHMAPVTQEDRDAAADWLDKQEDWSLAFAGSIRAGNEDEFELVQAFARHRLSTRLEPHPDRVDDDLTAVYLLGVHDGRKAALTADPLLREVAGVLRDIVCKFDAAPDFVKGVPLGIRKARTLLTKLETHNAK